MKCRNWKKAVRRNSIKTSRRRCVLCAGNVAGQNTNDTNIVNYIQLLVKPTHNTGLNSSNGVKRGRQSKISGLKSFLNGFI
ncbi:MAG: hypothetical protein ACT4OJ_05500 [Bacteroidota bacterium]